MSELQIQSDAVRFVTAPSHRQPLLTSLVEVLQAQATRDGDAIAYTYLHEDGCDTKLSFHELDVRARAIAATLQQQSNMGQRVLLVYPPGLDFICGFFGCLYAGVLAVPATYPKPRRPIPRLTAIANDCAPTAALTTAQTLQTLDLNRVQPDLRGLNWVATDEIDDQGAAMWEPPSIERESLAFLQYTSGSTNDPKGVMVSHGNLLHNLEMIRQGFALRWDAKPRHKAVFWLPAYHDMGLIGGLLEPLYVGGHSTLMSPTMFLQQPVRWLQAISDYSADISGAPNFAYELCVNKITPQQRESLDLSHWKLAFCGAEPIRAETLERFSETFGPSGFRDDAFYPCYGLAEATLIASGTVGPSRPTIKRLMRSDLTADRAVDANGHPEREVQRMVGCGNALLDQRIAIVDPSTLRACEPGSVGEIWVRGPSVARGYWNKDEENERTFCARLSDSDDERFLRTGDLGFISDGHLFVTGRIKDVIVIRGRNHYPPDIERTVEQSDPSLCPSAGATFSVENDGRECLVIIHEVDRQYRDADFDKVIRKIRRAVALEHDLEVHAIVLIRQASLPMTTSGKPQRSRCREKFLANDFKVVASWTQDDTSSLAVSKNPKNVELSGNNGQSAGSGCLDNPLSTEAIDRRAERIESWLLDWLVQRVLVPQQEVDRDRPFADYGLDSLTAVEMSQELDEWLHVQLTPVIAWSYPTPATLAKYLAQEAVGAEPGVQDLSADEQLESSSGFEQLLADIESLSDDEAAAALRDC